jgi:uncharacterized small protein (DUF1192 family)
LEARTVPGRRPATNLSVMSHTEQAERIKTLADSLAADRLERERLKKLADERLAGLHQAVREFVRRTDGDPEARRS